MMKNAKLETKIYEMGRLIDLGKDEVKYALKSRKNIVLAGILAFFAFILVQNIAYGTLRYMGASINDFIQFSKFL
ncbi:hypothetical protein AYK24_02440 [Thermoplasmatales archaeon SG8-52-4]|nr:MAG: hypothetical protein AYK24_02440 [Thermoplasmatales archaeon SG8-52-4]